MNDKMIVNAAIQKLINGDDDHLVAAQVLIEFAHNIKVSNNIFRTKTLTKVNVDEQVRNRSNISKDTNITHGKKSYEEKHEGWIFERVGHYRVWRFEENEINFQPWNNVFESIALDMKNVSHLFDNTFYLNYCPTDPKLLEFGNITIKHMHPVPKLSYVLKNWMTIVFPFLFPPNFSFQSCARKMYIHREPIWKSP
jgi:hypothetical protein